MTAGDSNVHENPIEIDEFWCFTQVRDYTAPKVGVSLATDTDGAISDEGSGGISKFGCDEHPSLDSNDWSIDGSVGVGVVDFEPSNEEHPLHGDRIISLHSTLLVSNDDRSEEFEGSSTTYLNREQAEALALQLLNACVEHKQEGE